MKNGTIKVNRGHAGVVVAVGIVALHLLFAVRVVTAEYNPALDIINILFPSNDGSNSTGGATTLTTTPGSNPPLSPGVSIPAGFVAVPTGHCQDKLTTALNKLRSVKNQVIPIYVAASDQTATTGTRIPWEVFAAIHYIETGGSFNPNGSLISGRPIGEPEPDQGGVRYTSLLDSAHAAARVFRQKGEYVHYYNRVNGMTPATGIELIAGQFALYNAITQGECKIEQGINGYNGKYAGGTWPGIPPNGQCNGGGSPRRHDKGEAYIGDRHVYPSYCKDSAHETMYFHFHYGGNVVPYTNRVGALALMWGIQNDPEFRSFTNTSPTPIGPPLPTGDYHPITVSGLKYYPQCSSPAIPGAYWSSIALPGAPCQNRTYCQWGCGLTSSAMVLSSLGPREYDPKQFTDQYLASGAPNCYLSYTILRNMFTNANISTQSPQYFSTPIDIRSSQGTYLLDGYLQAGNTVLTYGNINGYTHFVWVVGKEGGHYKVMDPYWSAPTHGRSPAFPVVPYTSNRYYSFGIRSLMAIK